VPDARWAAIAAALLLHRRSRVHGPLSLFCSTGRRETTLRLTIAGQVTDVRLTYGDGAAVLASVGVSQWRLEVRHDDGLRATLDVDGERLALTASAGWLDAAGCCAPFADLSDAPPQRDDPFAHGLMTSTMHGQLSSLAVAPGQAVRRGEFVLAIEAMKMEHRFEAPIDGTVVEVGAAAGTQVAPGQLLLRIEAQEGA
jgi:acetyl/propionyl-CoA carboxylase alpha subunit